MKRFKRIFGHPVTSAVLFLLAFALLLPGSVGGTRAALNFFSDSFITQVETDNIGVTLMENGEKVSWRDYTTESDGRWNESKGRLLANMLAEGETVKLGSAYREDLSVMNSGNIPEYVRVTIYKYWVDEDGMKLQELSPSLIELNLVNSDKWLVDNTSTTAERTVLYYTDALNAGETSPLFADSLTISRGVAEKVTQTVRTETRDGNTYRTVTTTYDYDGAEFRIEARVDAVQTHNAQEAVWSAWGRHVNITGGKLTIKEG